MKIINIIEGHWAIAPIDYPNMIIKPKKRTGRLSFLVKPEDRNNFFKREPDQLPKAKRR